MLNRKLSSWLPALTGVALVTLSATCYGIEDRIVATFAADSEGAHDATGVSKTIGWSSAQNAGGGAGSGSAYVVVSWANADGWQASKLAIDDIGKTDLTWPGVDCRQYINLEFDLKVDVANSHPAVNGTYGGVQLVFQGWGGANGNPDTLGWVTMSSSTIENTTDWQHLSFQLSSYPYNANKVILNFFVNSGTNTIAYFIDNVRFTAPPSPPPTLSFKPAPPSGLTCIASKSGDQWQRQMIRTANGTFSFHTGTGAGPTTSYALTITNFPGADHSGFLAQMFLVPEYVGGDTTKTNMPWGPADASVDWNAGNVMYLTIGMNGDGSAYSDFRYKTNNFGDQTMASNDQDGGEYGTNRWSKGHIATLACPTGPLGTWTLTFNNNTSITWTAPDGSSTNFSIAAAAADIWKDP
ncbi:MAG TPA: hypothetical protein VN673_06335, partial [Clostridia bacterium]|nr:hypothetical protein [Clostridia bacterium]